MSPGKHFPDTTRADVVSLTHTDHDRMLRMFEVNKMAEWRREGRHKVPSLNKMLFVIDSFWEREISFPQMK